MIDLGGHMPTFILKLYMFSHLSPKKPHKCVLKPSEQGSFFQDDWFEVITCLGLIEKWMFSLPMSLETP